MPMGSSTRFLFAITVLALSAIVMPGCPAGFGGVIVVQDRVYAQGYVADSESDPPWRLRDLVLDVYMPDAMGRLLPALILVHGGGFSEGGKDDERIVEYANYFARRGFVCFAISYRLVQDEPPAPGYWDSVRFTSAVHAAIVDTKAAIRFVRANASEFGVDPSRIALLGESAGAIAGVTAAVTSSTNYATDGPEFPMPSTNNPGVSASLQTYIHFWGTADHVLLDVGPSDPPIMIVHGTDDDILLTPFAAALRLHAAAEIWGVPHEFYEADGFGHGAWNYTIRGRGLKALSLDFLNEHL